MNANCKTNDKRSETSRALELGFSSSKNENLFTQLIYTHYSLFLMPFQIHMLLLFLLNTFLKDCYTALLVHSGWENNKVHMIYSKSSEASDSFM